MPYIRAAVRQSQHPNHLPSAHTIAHEIHRATLIAHGLCRAGYPADPPPLPNPHRQSFPAIQPLHALVVGRPPPASLWRSIPKRMRFAAKSLNRFRCAPSRSAFRAHGGVSMLQPHQPAVVLDLDMAHGGPKSCRCYQFLESTSFNPQFPVSSRTTTCFSLTASASFTSPFSIPPYWPSRGRKFAP